MTRQLSRVPTFCIECGELINSGRRCRPHQREWDNRRNANPNRAAYRLAEYLSQPKTGICHICGLPGADTRDHIIPISVDQQSVITKPAHRKCNSRKYNRIT